MNIGKLSVPSALFFCKLKTAIQRKVVCCEFPGSPGVRTLCFHCWGTRFDPFLEKEMQPTPAFLPGEFQGQGSGLQPMGSQRVGHDWASNTQGPEILQAARLGKKKCKKKHYYNFKKFLKNPLLIFKRCLSNALLAPTHSHPPFNLCWQKASWKRDKNQSVQRVGDGRRLIPEPPGWPLPFLKAATSPRDSFPWSLFSNPDYPAAALTTHNPFTKIHLTSSLIFTLLPRYLLQIPTFQTTKISFAPTHSFDPSPRVTTWSFSWKGPYATSLGLRIPENLADAPTRG